MKSDDLDVEPTGDSLDGAEPHDPEDAAEDAGEALRAKKKRKAHDRPHRRPPRRSVPQVPGSQSE